MAANASLPSEVIIRRAGETESYSTSPTESMSFMFTGFPGAPEFCVGHGRRGDGPPLHRHPWATWEYVVEGRLRVVIGEEDFEAGPGDFFYTPPDTAHQYLILSETAHTVGVNHPDSRFIDIPTKVAPLFAADGPPDMAEISRRAADAGVTILGPPLTLDD